MSALRSLRSTSSIFEALEGSLRNQIRHWGWTVLVNELRYFLSVHPCLVAKSYPTLCYMPVACQAPLSMEFSRQEYWSGLPFPSPGDLPHPGIEPVSPASPALAGRFVTTEPPGRPHLLAELSVNEPPLYCDRLSITGSGYM